MLYIVWGLASSEVHREVGIISSQVFCHLRSFKGCVQTELVLVLVTTGCWSCGRNRETNRDIISVAVVLSRQKICIIMCICSDRLAVQDCEMHYMNAWLKRCVFNLYLNRESVSEPRTLSRRLFQSLGAKYEKVLPPLVDFAILGITKSPEFCDLRERVGL